jgi:hypothetical protein
VCAHLIYEETEPIASYNDDSVAYVPLQACSRDSKRGAVGKLWG